MKEHRIMADPLKFSAALFSFIVLAFLSWRSFELRSIVFGIIFILLAAVFLYVFFLYGAVLRFSPDGVRKEFLFIPIQTLTWDQIREVGVVGTKIFNGISKKRKTGRRYIYISAEELDENKRFKMTLEWPPHDGTLYCIYSRQNADAIQFLWQKPMAKYNAGDIFVNITE